MVAFVGISGQAGSGKDTVADYLVREVGFVKIALADPIKRYCMEVFNFSEEQLWGSSDKRNVPDKRYARPGGFLTPRYALQSNGTEWGRNCYSGVWIEYAIRMFGSILEAVKNEEPVRYNKIVGLERNVNLGPCPYKGVVISDLRFFDEIRALKRAGGNVIRIIGFGEGLTGNAGLHRSESEMQQIPDSEFDFIIENNGTLEDLKSKICKCIGFLTKPCF